jgi:hypothetical protein
MAISANGMEIPEVIGMAILLLFAQQILVKRRGIVSLPQKNTIAVERFRRVGEDMIDYSFTVEDPTVYTRPWTAVRPLPRLPDYRQYEYACHEGNYAMTYILRGARVEEAREMETNTPEN